MQSLPPFPAQSQRRVRDDTKRRRERVALQDVQGGEVMRQVAALFVRADSIYKDMPGVDAWDAERDARTWPGGCPVVAHPPCRAWGRLRQFAKPRADEKELALFALQQIRKFGGVLEHPAESSLWNEAFLPKPGEFPDERGGVEHRSRAVPLGAPRREGDVALHRGLHTLQPAAHAVSTGAPNPLRQAHSFIPSTAIHHQGRARAHAARFRRLARPGSPAMWPTAREDRRMTCPYDRWLPDQPAPMPDQGEECPCPSCML